MIKTRLKDLTVGDRFNTLLTKRQGVVELVWAANGSATSGGVVVHFDDALFDVTLHPDVVVGTTVN